MPAIDHNSEPNDTSAEYLRLTLALLGKYKLAITPVNYSLAYFYVSGKDSTLNAKLDKLFENIELWTDEASHILFSRFICTCDDPATIAFRREMLMVIEQLLGSILDLTGKTGLSNTSLKEYVNQLSSCDEPEQIKNIANNIVNETNHYISDSKEFEQNLRTSTEEIQLLKDELGQARKEASIDSLTQLNNRRGFDKALQESIISDQKNNTSLIIIDIDNFKSVNDNHGHLVGDKVLIGISSLLSKQMRGNDYLSRFGGEEFSIILRDTGITGAFTVAEKLRKSVEKLRFKQIKTGKQVEKITISLGVANFYSGETGENFIQRCDRALYRAKTLGKNRCVLAE